MIDPAICNAISTPEFRWVPIGQELPHSALLIIELPAAIMSSEQGWQFLISHLTLITPLRKAWLVLLSPLWWGGTWLKAKWLVPISEPVSGRVLIRIQVSCLGILDSLYHLFRFWLKVHLLQGAFSTHSILSHLWRVLNIIFYTTHLTIITNALSGHLSWSMCLVPLHYLQASPEAGTM